MCSRRRTGIVYEYRDLSDRPDRHGRTSRTERVDTTWNFAGSIGYRPNRTARIALGASYWQRESTLPSLRNYDGLRIGTVGYLRVLAMQSTQILRRILHAVF